MSVTNPFEGIAKMAEEAAVATIVDKIERPLKMAIAIGRFQQFSDTNRSRFNDANDND